MTRFLFDLYSNPFVLVSSDPLYILVSRPSLLRLCGLVFSRWARGCVYPCAVLVFARFIPRPVEGDVSVMRFGDLVISSGVSFRTCSTFPLSSSSVGLGSSYRRVCCRGDGVRICF